MLYETDSQEGQNRRGEITQPRIRASTRLEMVANEECLQAELALQSSLKELLDSVRKRPRGRGDSRTMG
jgi:hypothetical protein